jgi:glycerol-3-phosphate dehydrogenase (NAD(P)+)
MAKIAVFSAGSWGTAFSLVLADAGNDVTLWARREQVADNINRRHENTDYFRGVRLPTSIRASVDADEVAQGADYVVLSVPSQTLRSISPSGGRC